MGYLDINGEHDLRARKQMDGGKRRFKAKMERGENRVPRVAKEKRGKKKEEVTSPGRGRGGGMRVCEKTEIHALEHQLSGK